MPASDQWISGRGKYQQQAEGTNLSPPVEKNLRKSILCFKAVEYRR
jgi:hypothetical protein